jgi:hypothetical protein
LGDWLNVADLQGLARRAPLSGFDHLVDRGWQFRDWPRVSLHSESPARERFKLDAVSEILCLLGLLALTVLRHQYREYIDGLLLAVESREHFGSFEVRVGAEDTVRE